jgi:hypothetical protein
MERIELNFRETEYNYFLRELNRSKGKAQDFLDEVYNICHPDIPSSIILDIFEGKGEQTAKAVEDKVREDLAKARISSDTIIKLAVNGDLEKFYALYNNKPVVQFEHYSLFEVDENRKVNIKDGAIEKVKDNYCHFITTQRGKEVYDKHKAMIAAINDFIAFVPKTVEAGVESFIGYMGHTKHVEQPLLRYDEL